MHCQQVAYIKISRGLSFPFGKDFLKEIILTVLSKEAPASSWEVSCLITGDTVMKKLNRQFRGIDSSTDVLSFALSENSNPGEGCRPKTGGPVNYGEIIVSFPRIVAQAAEYGHDTKSELILLMVHGTLHLLGYDHMTSSDLQRMRRKERKYIKSIGESSIQP